MRRAPLDGVAVPPNDQKLTSTARMGKLKTFACRAPSSWRLRLTVQRLVRLRCCNFLKESLAASKVDRITVWQGARLGGRLAGPPVGHLPCQSITIQSKEKKTSKHWHFKASAYPPMKMSTIRTFIQFLEVYFASASDRIKPKGRLKISLPRQREG